MARQGRFARTSTGSQNMSSLIYSLLREERNNQEESMLTAYANNMRSGTARNSYTSGGVTTTATSDSVYAWYTAQAELARDTGDSTGYERLMQRAEQFRLSSLKDKEDLARSAYSYGTSVDKSLFGGTGSGALDLAEYEAILDKIASDPTMTDSDKSRINLSKFTASHNFTSSDLIRKYKAGTISANSLVSFYDKELARAREAGFTESSQQYQDILNSRADAQERSKADVAKARVDAVGAKIKDEQIALARSIQSLIKPVLSRYFSSQNTVDSLSADIKGDGQDWLVSLLNLFDSNSSKSLSTLIQDAGLSAGWDQATIDTFFEKVNSFSDEVDSLYAAGYIDETKLLRQLAGVINANASQGTYNVSMRNATNEFSSSVSQAGGAITAPFSSDPYKFVQEFNVWKGSATSISESDKYEDIILADQVSRVANGNMVDLFPGTTATTMEEFVAEVASSTGLDEQTVIRSIGTLSTNINDYWNSNDSALATVAAQLNAMSNGTIRANLALGISGGGQVTIGTIFGSAATQELVRVVDADPNLVMAYQFDPQSKSTIFVPVQNTAVSNDSSYATWSTTGRADQIVYVKREAVRTEGSNPNDAGGEVKINGATLYYVPIPGGSNFAGSTGQSMDNNDYLEFVSGGNTYRLTLADLEGFMGDSGIAGTTPRVSNTNSGGVITIGDSLARILGGTQFNQWLIAGYSSKGSDWYNRVVTVGKDTTGSNDSIKDLASSYAQRVLSQIPKDFTGDLAATIETYLKKFGITDKTGKLTGMISDIIQPQLIDPVREQQKQRYTDIYGSGVDASYINNTNYPANTGSGSSIAPYGYGSQSWLDRNPSISSLQLPPNQTPPSIPGSSNTIPNQSLGLGPTSPPTRDQLGGQDWFFRNLGGGLNNNSIQTPPAINPVRGTSTIPNKL